MLVVLVSLWRAWSPPGLTAPFGRGVSWASPSTSKKAHGASGTWPAPQQGSPIPQAEPHVLSGCVTEMV